MTRLLLILPVLSIQFLQAQTPVKKYVNDPANQHRWLREYVQFVSIPNVLGDSINIQRNAEYISSWLSKLGVKAELLQSGKPKSAPVVFGEVKVPGAKQTVAFYAHYDGQPVNPKQWAEGLEPFTPVLFTDRLDKGGKKIPFQTEKEKIDSNWRLYGRAASDDKAGVFSIITAYEALVKNKIKPSINIQFFFEGEEEAGSINLGEIFTKYKNKLNADFWVICDGPRHISGKKQLVFGVRGDVNVDLKVYASKRPLHSGNYGNWAPNPAMRLAQLLATMKDADGKVLVDGFYDDVTPFTESEKQALSKIPRVEEKLQEDLALGKPDGDGKTFMELLSLPTLNINGMQSGNVGAMASNQIPTEASAVLDLRLVLGNDALRQVNRIIEHVSKQGYYVIDHEPLDVERRESPLLAKITVRAGGYNAQRTPMDLPMAQKVSSAIQSTIDYDLVKVPSAGGSLPLFLFEQMLGAKPVTIPVVNYDNNQHAENENVILQYLWEGVETMAAVMQMK